MSATTVLFTIPIRLPSLANSRMHWRAMAKLKMSQKDATLRCMHGLDLPRPPLVVTITRVGKGRLDDDNLAAACKYVRDAVAARIGVDDGSPVYTWRYDQRKGRTPYVVVEISPRRP